MIRTSPNNNPNSFLKVIVASMLFIFLLGVGIVNSFSEFSNTNRLTGIAFIILAIPLIRHNFSVPRETVFYGAFILWAIVSGMIVAESNTLLWGATKTMVQLFPVILVVINLARVYKGPNLNFWILIAVAIILALNSFINGQSSDVFFGGASIRESSFMANPNDFGAFMIVGCASALFLLGKANVSQRLFLIGVFVFFAVGIVLSGSRKGFSSLLVLIFAWLWFCYSKYLIRRPVYLILIIVVLLGTWYFTDYIINNTFLGLRILLVWRDPGQNTVRFTLYQEAFKVFLSYPLAGVGLNNFQLFSSSGMYAHSDYGEVLAGTGVFGVFFYFSMYVALWLRLNRIERRIVLPEVFYSVGVFKAAIVSILVIGLGQPNFNGIFKMFFFANIIGCAIFLEKNQKDER